MNPRTYSSLLTQYWTAQEVSRRLAIPPNLAQQICNACDGVCRQDEDGRNSVSARFVEMLLFHTADRFELMCSHMGRLPRQALSGAILSEPGTLFGRAQQEPSDEIQKLTVDFIQQVAELSAALAELKEDDAA